MIFSITVKDRVDVTNVLTAMETFTDASLLEKHPRCNELLYTCPDTHRYVQIARHLQHVAGVHCVTSELYTIKKEGVILFTGSENACFGQLLSIQGNSVDYALKWGGYAIEEIHTGIDK